MPIILPESEVTNNEMEHGPKLNNDVQLEGEDMNSKLPKALESDIGATCVPRPSQIPTPVQSL